MIALFVDVPQPFDRQAFYETILVNLQIGVHVDQQTVSLLKTNYLFQKFSFSFDVSKKKEI